VSRLEGPVEAVIVKMADAEPNGLATMLGDLLRSNVQRHPHRTMLLRPACIGVRASDIGLSATLDLGPGRVTVSNGLAKARLDVKVRSDGATLVELTTVPLLVGLPNVFRSEGRSVVRKLSAGTLKVTGLGRHPFVLMRLMKLLSVN